MTNVDEPSPFGCYAVGAADSELAGAQADDVASLLQSPFASACIALDDGDHQNAAAPGGSRQAAAAGGGGDVACRTAGAGVSLAAAGAKAAGKQQTPSRSGSGEDGPSGLRASSATTPSGNGDWPGAGLTRPAISEPDNGVASILESPFVSACVSSELRNLDERLAFTANDLASETAAVSLGKA